MQQALSAKCRYVAHSHALVLSSCSEGDFSGKHIKNIITLLAQSCQ